MRIKQRETLRTSAGGEFLIPYGTIYMSTEAVPDTLKEAQSEGADQRVLCDLFHRACAYAQMDGAERRAKGLSVFEPIAIHLRATAGPLEVHSIQIFAAPARVYQAPLATYDPNRDSPQEGVELDKLADDGAANMTLALLHFMKSDAPLDISGGGIGSVVEN